MKTFIILVCAVVIAFGLTALVFGAELIKNEDDPF